MSATILVCLLIQEGRGGAAETSPYVGGESRVEAGGKLVHVAVAGAGASLSDPQGVAVQSVLSQVLRAGTTFLDHWRRGYSPSRITVVRLGRHRRPKIRSLSRYCRKRTSQRCGACWCLPRERLYCDQKSHARLQRGTMLERLFLQPFLPSSRCVLTTLPSVPPRLVLRCLCLLAPSLELLSLSTEPCKSLPQELLFLPATSLPSFPMSRQLT